MYLTEGMSTTGLGKLTPFTVYLTVSLQELAESTGKRDIGQMDS